MVNETIRERTEDISNTRDDYRITNTSTIWHGANESSVHHTIIQVAPSKKHNH